MAFSSILAAHRSDLAFAAYLGDTKRMTTALFILGIVVVLVGLGLILFAPKPQTATKGAEARGLDPEKILEQVNALVEKLDQRYRIGAFVMMAGLALIGIAAYLKAGDAKDEAEQATALIRILWLG